MEHQHFFNSTNYNIDETNLNFQSDDGFFSLYDLDDGLYNFDNYDELQCLLSEPNNNNVNGELYINSDNITEKINPNQIKKKQKRSPKEIIPLNQNGEKFVHHTCQVLTRNKRKAVRKELVLKYHAMACERDNRIRRVERSEYRSINKYFNGFVDQEYLILRAFRELINEGKINYEKDYRVLISKNRL